MLARTNRELWPLAAAALELGVAYHAEADGLLLDDERIWAALDRASEVMPLLPALAAAATACGLPGELAGSLLSWAAPFDALADLRAAMLDRRTARQQPSGDAGLTLATIHGTKGLEWAHVACIGHDEGTFPSGRALREAADPVRVMEEERRLAYVAWTRAVRTLTIVYDPGAPSTFVLEAFDADELA